MNGYEILGKCLVAGVSVSLAIGILVVGILILFIYWPRKYDD